MPASSKMSYVDMIQRACETLGVRGKFTSRAQIKRFMTDNFDYVDTAMAKNAVRNALQKFERKGDSFRITEQMRSTKQSAEKKAVLKAKASVKKAQTKEKSALKRAALRQKRTAALEKAKAKKAAIKKRALEKKAVVKAKRAAKKTTKKKISKKTATKKAVKKVAKK